MVASWVLTSNSPFIFFLLTLKRQQISWGKQIILRNNRNVVKFQKSRKNVYFSLTWLVCKWFTPETEHPTSEKLNCQFSSKGYINLISPVILKNYLRVLTASKPSPFFSQLTDYSVLKTTCLREDTIYAFV